MPRYRLAADVPQHPDGRQQRPRVAVTPGLPVNGKRGQWQLLQVRVQAGQDGDTGGNQLSHFRGEPAGGPGSSSDQPQQSRRAVERRGFSWISVSPPPCSGSGSMRISARSAFTTTSIRFEPPASRSTRQAPTIQRSGQGAAGSPGYRGARRSPACLALRVQAVDGVMSLGGLARLQRAIGVAKMCPALHERQPRSGRGSGLRALGCGEGRAQLLTPCTRGRELLGGLGPPFVPFVLQAKCPPGS